MVEIYFIIFFFISTVFLIIGWKLRKLYKNVYFFLYKRRGSKSEKKARILLKKNKYKIIKYQYYQNNYLFENNKKKYFSFKPDFLVEKDGNTYVAEVKSGYSACIENIRTRRQLLEYSVYNKNKMIILIDTKNNLIKEINFNI